MSKDSAFWVVWNPSRGAPTQRHHDRKKAQREAERLARLSPGDRFYVLEAVSLTRKVDVETVDLLPPDELPDEIPF